MKQGEDTVNGDRITKDRVVGMYVHTHWGYAYPYAARTWRLKDWELFLAALKECGYNRVQVWPMIDTMPLPLTESDRAWLGTLSGAIEFARRRCGMQVVAGGSANTVGNSRAEAYEFASRPYFISERLLNPAEAEEMALLTRHRRECLARLGSMDGYWIIDSDPGGFRGSDNGEFVRLLALHRGILDELGGDIPLLYWMWEGWETNRHIYPPLAEQAYADCWKDTLVRIEAADLDPVEYLVCLPEQLAVVQALGLTERAIGFPYGAIELEPSYPFTTIDWERLEGRSAPLRLPGGVQGNAQTHCLQIPHILAFAHIARHGSLKAFDLRSAAEKLIPGWGDALAEAWRTLGADDIGLIERSGLELSRPPGAQRLRVGPMSGLFFGDAERLLRDLTLQLRLKRCVLETEGELAAGRDPDAAFGKAVEALVAWQERHLFDDFFLGDSFTRLFHPTAAAFAESTGGESGAQILRQLRWRPDRPERRHGYVSRLLAAMCRAVQ